MRNTFYLIGIDPGSNTGVAIFELTSDTLEIISINTTTILLNYVTSLNNDLQLQRIRMLGEICNNLYNAYQPNVLAMEAAFLNSRFPKAVMQLSQYTSIVEQEFYNCDNFIKRYTYAPKYIKRMIGAGGNADKDAMLDAIKKIKELSSVIDLNRVTEHEIDAIAIGYITIEHLRLYPHELISY